MPDNYENEQRTLMNKVAEEEKKLACIERTSLDLKTSLKVLRNSTSFEELTPTLVNSLIRRIEVHNNDKASGHCYVKVDIYFTAIGLIDIPIEGEIKSLMAKIKKICLKRENGATPVVGLHRIPAKNILMGLWLTGRPAFLLLCFRNAPGEKLCRGQGGERAERGKAEGIELVAGIARQPMQGGERPERRRAGPVGTGDSVRPEMSGSAQKARHTHTGSEKNAALRGRKGEGVRREGAQNARWHGRGIEGETVGAQERRLRHKGRGEHHMLCVYAALRGVEYAVPESEDRGMDKQLKMGQKTVEEPHGVQLPLLRKTEQPPVRKGVLGYQSTEGGRLPVALSF